MIFESILTIVRSATQRELDTLAAQLEKDVATLKLKYAKRKQHLESVVRGKASYAAQGGQ